jgi:hypothetical protein
VHQLLEAMKQMHDKYEELVAAARFPEGRIDEARAKFPEEVARLEDEEHCDWEHGFNSGVLATVRLILDALDPEAGLECGLASFPELHT